ncbi:TPA: hypothetical protein ACM3G5_004607, partial [Escherichia coli]
EGRRFKSGPRNQFIRMLTNRKATISLRFFRFYASLPVSVKPETMSKPLISLNQSYPSYLYIKHIPH